MEGFYVLTCLPYNILMSAKDAIETFLQLEHGRAAVTFHFPARRSKRVRFPGAPSCGRSVLLLKECH